VICLAPKSLSKKEVISLGEFRRQSNLVVGDADGLFGEELGGRHDLGPAPEMLRLEARESVLLRDPLAQGPPPHLSPLVQARRRAQ